MRIVKETGKPVSHAAWNLGINEYTLHNWMQIDRQPAAGSVATASMDNPPLGRTPEPPTMTAHASA